MVVKIQHKNIWNFQLKFIEKKKRCKINDVSFYFKKLEKEEIK